MPSGLGAAAKFNPQLWKPDELRAIFVARLDELAQLVQRLRDADATPKHPPQHVLISGQRGMGKSTLLHRLALEVEDDAALRSRWMPLLFREEQYTAVTLDKFWRNAIDALSEALERRAARQPVLDPALAAAMAAEVATLDALNAKLDATSESRQREDLALAGLRDWADRHQTRLLLLVDSTEVLFAGLAHGRGDSHQALWRLRELLSQDARFLWIGCGYAPLEAKAGHEHPFFEFFAPLQLRPLTVDDMRATLLALAKAFGAGRGLVGAAAQAEMQRLAGEQPERLETLLRLAGGNPRTTVLLYQLLAAGGHDNVHADLQRLLDDMSPLYKDRLENQLAIQPRQLMATLMEHWAPMAAHQLAGAAAMPVTQVNSQLSRLEADGWIEKVRLPGTRRNGYQVAERFFNIWYLMRLAPRRLRLRLTWLVEFMRAWFTPRELGDMARARAAGLRAGQLTDERQYEFSRAISLSLPSESIERAQLELTLLAKTVRGRIGEIALFDFDAEDRPFASVEDYRQRFLALRPLLEKVPCLEGAWVEMATASLTLTLANKERLASVGATMSASDVDSVRRLLTDELDILTTVCADTEALALVRQRVLTGDFFPDAPVTAAQLQARAWFSASPTAHALAVILISANHPTAPETATLLSEVTVSALTAPFLLANLGAAAVRAGRPGEARVAYRKASVLLGAASAEPNEHTQIRLRAHLYLGNQDAAMQALTALCIGLDDSRNVDATMRRLEQQAHACNAIGLTNSFADLLLRSPHWGLLQPLGLAMKLLSGDDQLLLAAPFEVQQMAREVAERLST